MELFRRRTKAMLGRRGSLLMGLFFLGGSGSLPRVTPLVPWRS